VVLEKKELKLDLESGSRSSEIVPGWNFNEIATLIKRGFYKDDFYIKTYVDVARSGMNPLLHYLEQGWREGRQPSELIKFSEIEFLENIKEYLRNPLELFELNHPEDLEDC
jgi:hypothetical protein